MTSTGAVHEMPPTHDEPSGHDASADRSARSKRSGVEPTANPGPPAELTDVSLQWSDLGLFLACYAALVAVWFAFGAIVETSAVTSFDQRVADWFVEQRTPDLDIASEWGSGLADTFVKIGVTAVLAIGMWLAWKRWREPLMMVMPLVLEASAFITVTYLVARPRPEDQLESSPVNSSFPSGHVAAAAAYSALVIIVFWHTRKLWARALVIVVSVAIPIIVALARMYRGMHFLTDVIGGAALGVASVALSWWIIHRAVVRNETNTPAHPDSTDAHAVTA
jgi:undecaprenyl-diphosphatase